MQRPLEVAVDLFGRTGNGRGPLIFYDASGLWTSTTVGATDSACRQLELVDENLPFGR